MRDQRRLSKKNSSCLFHDLISKLRLENIVKGKNRFFNVGIDEICFNSHNMRKNGIEISIDNIRAIAGRDIIIAYTREANSIICQIIFDNKLFSTAFIQTLSESLELLFTECFADPNKEVCKLSLLSKETYNQIIYDWNQTETHYPKDKTIHQLFEEQVKKTPDNIAVVFNDKRLTYRELNAKTNQLAHTIRQEYKEHWEEEIKGDTLIGIYIERSLEMIIGILGILKSGATHVPFDNADPKERLKFKVNDCGCKMVLTSFSCAEDLIFLAESDTLPLAIDSYWEEISKAPQRNPQQINKSTDLAYVIYTSGSTGKPKGVMVEHCGIINLTKSHTKTFRLDKANRNMLLFSSISFDASVSTIFCCLLSGNTLYIPDVKARMEPDVLQRYILDNKISFLDVPAKWLKSFGYRRIAQFKKSSTIIVAGDICDNDTMNICGKYTNLINAYGPTESYGMYYYS